MRLRDLIAQQRKEERMVVGFDSSRYSRKITNLKAKKQFEELGTKLFYQQSECGLIRKGNNQVSQ